jgi:putative membrane protein
MMIRTTANYALSVIGIAALAGATALFAAPRSQQQPGAQGGMQSQNAANPDAQFARKAGEGGLEEVQLGKLAQQNGQSQAVKDFGERMVRDHSQANDQLKQVASQENIRVPRALRGQAQTTYTQLSSLNGAAFDQAYARDMIRDHEKDIAEFKQEANSGSDPNLKNFAAQTLPTLEEHLKLAREMLRQVNGSNGGGH